MPEDDRAVSLRRADPADAAQLVAIYNPLVTHSIVTFEEAALEDEEIAGRIADVHSKGLPWYVAVEESTILGYAYAMPWRPRSAYRFSVEVTVYVAPSHTRRGIAKRLYTTLLDSLRRSGFRTAVAGIALPNPASIALHERLGFEKVAHFRQIGFKLDRWVDVGYWQLLL